MYIRKASFFTRNLIFKKMSRTCRPQVYVKTPNQASRINTFTKAHHITLGGCKGLKIYKYYISSSCNTKSTCETHQSWEKFIVLMVQRTPYSTCTRYSEL